MVKADYIATIIEEIHFQESPTKNNGLDGGIEFVTLLAKQVDGISCIVFEADVLQ